jgi:type I restriction enzyme S subunit
MKPYPKYKHTGIEWIGEIPQEWEFVKLKYFAEINNGKDPSAVREESGKFPIYGSGGIFGRSNEYLYEGPSVLLGRKGTINNPQFVNEPFWAVDTAFYTKIKTGISPKFFYYLCQTLRFDLLSYGSAVPSMTQSVLNEQKLAKPSLEEQSILSQYLDYKISLIDSLISKNNQLIQLLEEKKQATINQAVTKGLNPNVKMKDSGIEWIREIPEHWELIKIKYVAELKSGDSITSERIYESGDYPVYGGNGTRGFTDSYTHSGEYPLIGRQGALCGNINYSKGKFWASEHAVVVSPKTPLNTYWIGELLRMMNLNQYSVSAAQPGLSVERINNLHIPVPSLTEQGDIAKLVFDLISNIESISHKLTRQNNLLQEYRQALISNAVTGKIDVQDETIPEEFTKEQMV